MLEKLVVGVVVAAAFLYAAWALMTPGLRAGLARRVRAWSETPQRPAWLAATGLRIERALRARGGGCSDCSVAKSAPATDPGKTRPKG